MSTPDFSDGVMVALKIPPGTASRLAIPGGTPQDELHCTLAYMGSAQDLSETDKQGIIDSAREVATTHYPLPGSIPSRVGTFEAGDDGIPYWADPGSPPVHNLRESLMRSLQLRGLDQHVANDHEFNPHVTLSYLDDPAQQPDPVTVPSPEPFTFDTVLVKIGPDSHEFPLGGAPFVTPPDPALVPDPIPLDIPPAPGPVPASPIAASGRVRISPPVEHTLRRLLDTHNASARLGQRTSIEVIRAVYLRGANDPVSSQTLQASARSFRGMDRVHSFINALTAGAPTCTDRDLFPPAPRRSSLSEVIALAHTYQAHEIADALTASLLSPPASPKRPFALNRALALAATSPTASVRAALPTRLRALIADGNSTASRSLRAKRQLRDRYGRWIEQGGGVRFKIRQPGAPGGGEWFHGKVTGQDVPNGLVNVRLDDGREVAVPAEKIEQPLAILRTDPSQVGDRPQDKAAPSVTPKEPTADDTGSQPTPDETQAAIDDAGKELAKRVGDDSTEAHHRDKLLDSAQEATSATNTPEELQDHLASLAEYADTVAQGNQGRMSPKERDAFRAYAEDLQDIVAAQRPTVARLDRAPEAAPDASPEPAPVDVPAAPAPTSPDAIPVNTSNPDDLLPELGEFSDAAQAVQAAHQATDPDSPARDRLAAVNNVLENVGEDFLGGDPDTDASVAMDALNKAHDELDSVLSDHFDDLGTGAEDEINDAMDRIKAISAKIETWNNTPDAPPDSQPTSEETPDAVPSEAPAAPTPVQAQSPDARQRLSNAIEREQHFLDQEPDFEAGEGRGFQSAPQEAQDALEAIKTAFLNEDGATPEEQMNRIDSALEDYRAALPDPDEAYSLENAVHAYREAQGIQPTADANAPAFDPWANPNPRAIKSEIDADPVNSERVQFEDMRADFENGLLPDEELVPKFQELHNKLDDQKDSPEALDLASEMRQWFNAREPVATNPDQTQSPDATPAPDAPPADANLPMQDMNGDTLNPGEWVDIGDGTIKGELVSVGDGEVRIKSADGQETNVAVTPAQIRKLSLEEVEALGGDPTGRGLPPAPSPDGETDQFGNVVPARVKLNRETNVPGGGKIQVYDLGDDSKVDIAVGKGPNGDPRYVVRYRNSARSNHDNWDDAVTAAQAEAERVAPMHQENQVRRDQDAQRRAVQEQDRLDEAKRRLDGNLDEADRELPEGWKRTELPNGQAVMTGPGRYRAFSDPDGKLHLMVRDNQGGFASLGSFDDWPQLQNAADADAPRRAQDGRDNFAEWLSGHGFSDDAVERFRVNSDGQGALDHIRSDPAYGEMSRAAQDAAEVTRQTPQQRKAADDWAALQQQMNQVEDLPAPDSPAPDPGAEGVDPNAPAPVRPDANLNPAQQEVIDNLVADMEDNGENDAADAMNEYLLGMRPNLLDLDIDTRENLRDEIIGRANAAAAADELQANEVRGLVEFADKLYGEQLPAVDPNDGILPESTPGEAPADVLPDAPPAPDAVAAPGAPPGQEGRYHPDGVIQDRDGNQLKAGDRVKARRDGAEGVITAIQQQPPYARIRFDDGRVMVRAGNQLNMMRDEPAAPAPQAPAPQAAPAPTPLDPRDLVAIGRDISAVREQIPRRIGRAGHADPAQVKLRNAGFALDDAILALNDGKTFTARRHLAKAAERASGNSAIARQINELQQRMEDGVPAARADAPGGPPAGPQALVEGRQPADWLVPVQAGNLGERPLDQSVPGVTPATPPETVLDAANPTANVDDFSDWGDRAGQITAAARNRPGFEALQEAGSYGDQENLLARIFNADGTTFGTGGYSARIRDIEHGQSHTDTHSEYYQASFNIHDKDGKLIPNARVTRAIIHNPDTGKWYVDNSYMGFQDPEYRGSGFAQAWNRNVENWAIANKMEAVRVHASLDKGSAVWALNGFDWDPIHEYSIGGQAKKMIGYVNDKATTPAEKAQVAELKKRIDAATRAQDQSLVPKPIELALVGWRPGLDGASWAGVQGMTRDQGGVFKDWYGVKPLNADNPIYAQADGYARARRASERVRNNENVAEVSDKFVHDIAQDEFTGLPLTATERAEVAEALTNNRSLAVLTPETKRKLGDWLKDALNKHGGDKEHFESQYSLLRGLHGEQAADAPPAPLGVGEQLLNVKFNDFELNNVPGFKVENLGAEGLAGINRTWRVTHNASGQVFFVKNDTFQGAVGRNQSAGRNSEADVNQLLRLAGPGGWIGINENRPSNVEPAIIVQQRVGDNIDLKTRPLNAGGSGSHAVRAIEENDSPDAGLRMVLLDVVLGNGDRHIGNWQVAQGANGRFHIFPIDHGLAGGGNNWGVVDQMSVSSRLDYVSRQANFRYVKNHLADFDAHSVEYMARQILQDYRDALDKSSEWWDPQFQAKVGKSLADVERSLRAILRKLGK